MADNERSITLQGRIFIRGQIRLLTGLHIGAARAALSIGGLDNPVVRDPLTKKPYVPGSSLKGKLRSLLEKQYGLSQNQSIGKNVYIHVCDTSEHYQGCVVGHIFGVPGEKEFSSPTRLVVRDVPLDDASADALQKARTDLPFTEVKWEAAIDRITAAATPRQMERVPAGAVFSPMEMVYNLYEQADFARLPVLLNGLQLLEDDYLGGLGSRGSGKVAFENLKLTRKRRDNYQIEESFDGVFPSLKELLNQSEGILAWLREKLPLS